MRRWLVPMTVFAATGLVLSIVGLVTLSMRSGSGGPAPHEPEPLAVGLSIPEFAAKDQAGRERTQDLLDGQITILDFIFTNCPFACPMMTYSMVQVAQDLKGTPVKFVSFSVDPEHDTPEKLHAFAERMGLDPERWTLLTSEPATVDRVVRQALQFALGPDKERKVTLPDGSQMDNITHPTRLLLIGPDRRVLGFYDHNVPEEMDRLKRRARIAAEALNATR